MAWSRMCGTAAKKLFTWVGSTVAWSNGFGGTVLPKAQYITAQTVGTGTIAPRSTLYYSFRYSGLGGYNSDIFSINIKPHGSQSYTNLFNIVLGSASYGQVTDSFDLSSYAGYDLDIQVVCYNAGNSQGSIQLDRLDISNAEKDFNWDVKTSGGFDSTSLTLIGSTDGYMTASNPSPKIVNGCHLSYSINIGNASNIVTILQSEDNGSTWHSIVYEATGSSVISGTVDLTAYAGQNLLCRVRVINRTSSTITATISGLSISNI